MKSYFISYGESFSRKGSAVNFSKMYKAACLAVALFGVFSIVSCGDPGVVVDDDDTPQVVVDPTETGDSLLLVSHFDSGIPAGWRNIDQDGDGLKWNTYSDEFDMGSGGTFIGYMGSDLLVSSSRVDITPDNLIVSPSIHIPGSGGYVLSLWIGGLDANKFEEHYSVYVGTMKDGVFKPQSTLMSETTTGSYMVHKSVSLDDFCGYDVCIAIRHHNTTDMGYLLLDEVVVYHDAPEVGRR